MTKKSLLRTDLKNAIRCTGRDILMLRGRRYLCDRKNLKESGNERPEGPMIV